VLDEFTELAVDVLADLVQFPLFPEKEIEKEKLVVLEELKMPRMIRTTLSMTILKRTFIQAIPFVFPCSDRLRMYRHSKGRISLPTFEIGTAPAILS